MSWWSSNSGRIELDIPRILAEMGSHQDQCEDEVVYLVTVPKIRVQLDKLDPDDVRRELVEYGAWEDDDLVDHETNLKRLVWIACCDIIEGNN